MNQLLKSFIESSIRSSNVDDLVPKTGKYLCNLEIKTESGYYSYHGIRILPNAVYKRLKNHPDIHSVRVEIV